MVEHCRWIAPQFVSARSQFALSNTHSLCRIICLDDAVKKIALPKPCIKPGPYQKHEAPCTWLRPPPGDHHLWECTLGLDWSSPPGGSCIGMAIQTELHNTQTEYEYGITWYNTLRRMGYSEPKTNVGSGFPKLGKGCSEWFSEANPERLFLGTSVQPKVVCCGKSQGAIDP